MATDSSTASASSAAATAGKIGLVPATLMVAGNMMGSGVFMLPANLAAIGGIAVFGWIITLVGALSLALVFAKLAAIDPLAGGPYAYARKAFGDYMGYQTNLIYWLANVVGNVGLAVAGLGYLSHFFPVLKNPLVLALGQIAVVWFFTYANILGPRFVGRMQSLTTVFALVPIIGMALFGWFWFHADTYAAGWNVSGKDSIGAVGATLNFTLWAFIGVETASVSAGVVANPSRNVPIATLGGVILAGICYVLSSSAVMGMIPNKELIASAAPFADAARIALGPLAANIVAGCAAIGCLGSLAGWTLLVGQTAKAAADDGLFPNVFAKINSKGVPSAGLAIVAVIMTVQIIATMSPTASEQFGKIASIAVIMTLLPYIYSAISIKVLAYKKISHHEYTIYAAIALVAAIYSLWAMVGSDGEQTRWSLIFVITTIVFYSLSLNHKRDVEEHVMTPGGRAPRWIRYATLAITIVALALMFWQSVGRFGAGSLLTRSPQPPVAQSSVPSNAPAGVPETTPAQSGAAGQ
ncbi:arginine/agmatine antiporter [Segnochrobactrum spirostomi]|uniref:Arginine/agmatine antiporter n=1 Tax=Segnochrobactrum spirostomi TaxID=2608987 RepID=A0A6A7Y4H0_9HYPH|nr:arginine/agmatine antiporter [Segnochrobactrum spirostomi]MQT12642.1 arginine/agmatine antiporter [Segnochrobactrum spirostomi]